MAFREWIICNYTFEILDIYISVGNELKILKFHKLK